jgi:hypothetical protein
MISFIERAVLHSRTILEGGAVEKGGTDLRGKRSQAVAFTIAPCLGDNTEEEDDDPETLFRFPR